MNNPRPITYLGETKTRAEWARITGLNQNTIRSRLHSGWSVERTLTEGVNTPKFIIEFDGNKHSVSEWAQIYNISESTLYDRIIKRRMSFFDAVNVPNKRKSFHKAHPLTRINRGIESWQDVMRIYFTKEHRIKCYKKLKSDYEDIKREAMTRAA